MQTCVARFALKRSNMSSKKTVTLKIALGGIITALSVVLMLFAGFTSSLVYAIPMIAGLLLMALVVEFGTEFTFLVYVAVSLISILILGNKEAAIMYISFFGYYPIIKSIFEKHFRKITCWLLKCVIFNIAMCVFYFISSKIFMISYEDIEFLGKYSLLIFLLLGNILFLMYDVLLTRLVTIYIYKWRKNIKRVFK